MSILTSLLHLLYTEKAFLFAQIPSRVSYDVGELQNTESRHIQVNLPHTWIHYFFFLTFGEKISQEKSPAKAKT